MRITLIAFGIAKEILKARQMEIELQAGDTVGSLRRNLVDRYPELAKLKSLGFAVGVNYQDDNHGLHENDEVVIIPPVSGG